MQKISLPHPTLSATEVNAFAASAYPAAAAFPCEEVGTTYVVTRWRFDDSALRPGGFISGPILFTSADASLWYLSFTALGLEAMAVTSNLHIDFLRPARGGDLCARAELLRAGKTRITGRVSMWIDGHEENPVAHATGSYSLLPPRTPGT